MCLAFCTLYVERGATPALHLKGRGGEGRAGEGRGGEGRGGERDGGEGRGGKGRGVRVCVLLGAFDIGGMRGCSISGNVIKSP